MGKDRRILRPNAGQILTPAKILTPQDEKRLFRMDGQSGMPYYVMEVPGCRAAGLPICLSTGKKEEVEKVIRMIPRFRAWFEKAWAEFPNM